MPGRADAVAGDDICEARQLRKLHTMLWIVYNFLTSPDVSTELRPNSQARGALTFADAMPESCPLGLIVRQGRVQANGGPKPKICPEAAFAIWGLFRPVTEHAAGTRTGHPEQGFLSHLSPR